MIHILFAVVLVASATVTETTSTARTDATAFERAPSGGPIKRGARLGNAFVVSITDILSRPAAFEGRTVRVKGVIQACCKVKGCWMEIAATRSDPGLRVTFKDYGFFVPTTSKGMRVVAEGIVTVEKLDREMVEHLNGEGAHITPDADGTATKVTFVATGVELRKR